MSQKPKITAEEAAKIMKAAEDQDLTADQKVSPTQTPQTKRPQTRKKNKSDKISILYLPLLFCCF